MNLFPATALHHFGQLVRIVPLYVTDAEVLGYTLLLKEGTGIYSVATRNGCRVEIEPWL
jgi:hypothetical protein